MPNALISCADKSAALVKDIGKMFGGILESHQEASEYAGKRVGTDNLVEFKKERMNTTFL
ncbi:hypothetical protein [Methylophaga sp.]|uniref:hypothetical protein n=1 Tax=Methylophaga sp. TaxID=2024840 RepID=UPI003F69ABB6